jgi:hypothetical protein
MNVTELQAQLEAHPEAALHLRLPDGSFVPPHFHVTEVGRIRKDFIDCGGTRRAVQSCSLQLWVADDTGHRLKAGKLAAILRLAAPLLEQEPLPVELEYEDAVISQYPLEAIEITPMGLLFALGGKHTDCLAKEKCGIPTSGAVGLGMASCDAPGCC